MPKEHLFGKTLPQLADIARELQLPAFTAKQMAQWLYAKNVTAIDQMTNLSKNARDLLARSFDIGRTAYTNVVESAIDGTKKYLFQTRGGYIETAVIPDDRRHTLCVSSQVGCKMGCAFCMTGRQGYQANLSATDILNQFASIDEAGQITNIVYMGMGEPLDNLKNVLDSIEILTSDWGYGLSPRRITVSTIGLPAVLPQFVENCEAHLAISLHAPTHEQRLSIMPAEKAFPIEKTMAVLRRYDWSRQRRLSFEYTIFQGINDTQAHVSQIAALLRGLPCRVNLIAFNAIPDSELKGAPQAAMEIFRDALNKKGITATIRNSKGSDISAACGLLSTLKKNEIENKQ